MEPASALLLMLLFGDWRPAPRVAPVRQLFLLRYTVKRDADAVAILDALESNTMGRVVEMMGFDGKNLSVIYERSPADAAAWETLGLPPGARLIEARPARALN